MRFLCSSSDFCLIEKVRCKLASSGVRCETRGFHPQEAPVSSPYVELWVNTGSDFLRAVELFAARLIYAEPETHIPHSLVAAPSELRQVGRASPG